MFPRVVDVTYLQDYILELSFADGTKSQTDFRAKVFGHGGVFLPLKDPEFFRRVRIDREAGTLVWPNDLDLDPDVLYSEATGAPLQVAPVT